MKAPDTSTVRISSTASSTTGKVPTAAGARLGTVTAKPCWALKPPPSVAVTVTVAEPALTPTTVTVLPVTEPVATPAFDEPTV